MTLINLHDYERAAKDIMSAMAYGYFVGGAGDNITVSENQEAFQRIKLWPKMLVDVSERDHSTSVNGQDINIPIVVAPTAMSGLAHADKEIGIAKAVKKVGSIYTSSTLATTSIEDLGKTGANLWFQLYVMRDRGVCKSLIERAEAAGFSALVVTVDAVTGGYREELRRIPLVLPDHLEIANLLAYWDRDNYGTISKWFGSQIDPSLTWSDIEEFVQSTKLPVYLKGILRPDDAERAVASGAAGIIVSNHGGRQLDTAVSGIEALPYVVEAVDDAVDILVDGGVRRGTDILKALAFGAKAVMLGRPILWGLAVNGQAGVEHIFEILRDEYDLALSNIGVASSSKITKDIIFLS